MILELHLDTSDPIEDAAHLKDYLDDADIEGLETEQMSKAATRGTMGGPEIMFGVLLFTLLKETVAPKLTEKLIDKIFEYFEGNKRASYEIKGTHSNNGSEMSMTIKFEKGATEAQREAAKKEVLDWVKQCSE